LQTWDKLDKELFHSVKAALREAIGIIKETKADWYHMPLVLIDFYRWEAKCFKDEYEAKEHIQEKHATDYDEPPSGEDEDLIIIKFCDDYAKTKWDILYEDYKFFKEIDGRKIYHKRQYVEFEPELVINVILWKGAGNMDKIIDFLAAKASREEQNLKAEVNRYLFQVVRGASEQEKADLLRALENNNAIDLLNVLVPLMYRERVSGEPLKTKNPDA
jgi:hypothetical protein